MIDEKRHKIEQALLPALAALPLFFTYVVSNPAVLLFWGFMGLLLFGIVVNRPVRVPAFLLGGLGVFYLFFFPIDAIFFSRSLVAPCSHLLFFIAVYQAIEAEWRDNEAQRLLVSFLIFVTAAATSTHWSIFFYVVGFGFMAYRELMQISWAGSVQETGSMAPLAPRSRYAGILAMVTIVIAIGMFPLLPRVRDPYVRGLPSLSATQSTGISDVIDFREERFGSEDPEVVARVWPGENGRAFLPVRLRASVYDAWDDEEWISSRRRLGLIAGSRAHEEWRIGAPRGIRGSYRVQQRRSNDQRVFLPEGTWRIEGLSDVHGTRFPGVVATDELRRRPIDYQAMLSQQIMPYLRREVPGVVRYPVSDEIRALAEEIVAGARNPLEASRQIERFLIQEFEYVADISDQGEPITVDQFLLEERRGHCEYFAAGMVVLLSALDMPARIVGGFYGGEPNEFSGYFVIRKSDAHAWVEVWDGELWQMFDPTPPDLRPGAGSRSIFRRLSALADSVSYLWDRWILTYGASDQVSLTRQIIEQGESLKASLSDLRRTVLRPELVAPLIALVLLLALATRLRLSRRRDLYRELLRRLEKMGFDIDDSMTGGEVASLVRGRDPELSADLDPLLRFHELSRFAPGSPDEGLERSARESLARLRSAS